MAESDDKLEALRVKRAALEAEREKKLAERAARDELAAEEMALRDFEAVEKAEAEHGEVGKMLAVVRSPIGCIIVKKPRWAEYRRFQDSKQKHEDAETLVYGCIVHPDLPTARSMIKDFPALFAAASQMVAKLSGTDFITDVVPK